MRQMENEMNVNDTANIGRQTSSIKLITDATMELYDKIVNPKLLIRRLNISANHVVPESSVSKEPVVEQLNLQEGATAKGRNEQIGGHKA